MTVYNNITEWSNTDNPNGTWAYGYKETKTGDFAAHTLHKLIWDVVTLWYEPLSSDTPSVFYNSDTNIHHNIQPGEVSIHPGPSGQWEVLRWTSPASGFFLIEGHFGAGDSATLTYSIIHNNTTLLFDISSAVTETFSLTVSVAIGDTIDFQVGDGWSYGNTPIDATITPITLMKATRPVNISGKIFSFKLITSVT